MLGKKVLINFQHEVLFFVYNAFIRRNKNAKYENEYSGEDIGTYNKHRTGSLNENPIIINRTVLNNEEPGNKSTSSVDRISDRVLLTESLTNGLQQNNTVFINKGFNGGSDMYSMPNKKINRSSASGGTSDQIQVDYDEYWRTKI